MPVANDPCKHSYVLKKRTVSVNSFGQEQNKYILKCKSCDLSKPTTKKQFHLLKKKPGHDPFGRKLHEFYDSKEWIALRYRVLKTYPNECMLCGSTKSLHVDHIKPRSKYPQLELFFDNLQILCRECNLGKSNNDETDFRPKPPPKTILRKSK